MGSINPSTYNTPMCKLYFDDKSKVTSWIRNKVNFALRRSILLCLGHERVYWAGNKIIKCAKINEF